MRKKISTIVFFVLTLCFFEGVGAYIGYITTPSLQGWYQNLNKAPLTPDGWVFALVWPILYGALAIVFTEILVKRPLSVIQTWLFITQMALNWVWSFVFFSFHQTGFAVAVLLILIINVFLLTALMKKEGKKSFWLLLPYLAWLCFALYLNTYIYMYN
tara:strand:- start:393 stop:866 length:474 start_codon:yes stop_codon:yes gene_type:complete